MRYSWPGNVRELRNVIERIVIMNPTTIEVRTEAPSAAYPPRWQSPGAGSEVFHACTRHATAYERDYILKKLDENHGNVSRTAEVLGLRTQPLVPEDEDFGNCREGIMQREAFARFAMLRDPLLLQHVNLFPLFLNWTSSINSLIRKMPRP